MWPSSFLACDRLNNASILPQYYQTEADVSNPFICSLPHDNGMQRCGGVLTYRPKSPRVPVCLPRHGRRGPNGSLACSDWGDLYTECHTGRVNPQNNAINFDNIGYAWIAIFQVPGVFSGLHALEKLFVSRTTANRFPHIIMFRDFTRFSLWDPLLPSPFFSFVCSNVPLRPPPFHHPFPCLLQPLVVPHCLHIAFLTFSSLFVLCTLNDVDYVRVCVWCVCVCVCECVCVFYPSFLQSLRY